MTTRQQFTFKRKYYIDPESILLAANRNSLEQLILGRPSFMLAYYFFVKHIYDELGAKVINS